MGGQKVYEKQLLILLPAIVGCLLNPVFFFSILVGELVIYDNFQWEDKSFFFSILVAARSNRGLSFVGSAGRELGEGSLMVRPHLCKSAVRAGDNQGLHTITPTHLSSRTGGGCTLPTRIPLNKQRQLSNRILLKGKPPLHLLPDLSQNRFATFGEQSFCAG